MGFQSGRKIMKWILVLFVLVVLAACGDFHEVTIQVESPDLTVDTSMVSWNIGSSRHWTAFPTPLPFEAIEHVRHVEFSVTADTSLDTAGTITATILIDGVPAQTDSVTASGSPASVTISAYIPN
jgi:hypothetical protein